MIISIPLHAKTPSTVSGKGSRFKYKVLLLYSAFLIVRVNWANLKKRLVECTRPI